MNAADVSQYLQDHPEFFESHADLMAEVFVPHPHGGHAISLAERQLLTLREKNRLLEAKLGELLSFGEENDAISEKVHRIAVTLLRTPSVEATVNTFLFHITENFNVPQATVRLWITDKDGAPATGSTPEFQGASEEVRAFALDLQHPYCGPHVSPEVLDWFGEAGKSLQSFAQVPLRHGETLGLLVMGSEDTHRFYPEMGTLYLTRLGELLAAAIQRNRSEVQS